MQLQKTHSNDFTTLNLRHNYKDTLTMRNFQLLIVSKSGHGKTLSAENIAEEMHRLGYVVIFLVDNKDEIEAAFSMFKPMMKYHLDGLARAPSGDKIGKEPQTIPTKIYHPFTFSLKTNQKLPEINFYTFNIKNLGSDDFSMMLETQSESNAVTLMKEGIAHLNKNQGLWEFMQYIGTKVRRKQRTHLGKRMYMPDWENFGLTASFAGTTTDVSNISAKFKPYLRDYCITPASCPYNLDLIKLLNDNQHYHVFTTRWITDPKIKDFVRFHLFNEIFEHRKYTHCKVLVVFEDIKNLVPFKAEGYQIFTALSLQKKLSVFRSKGEGGNSSIITSQTWTDVKESVMNSATETLIGQLAGLRDLARVSKDLKWSRETVEEVSSLPEGTYLRRGDEDSGRVRILLPSHAHKEEQYNFFKMYKKHYPEKMQTYKKLYEQMKALLKEEKQIAVERVTKKIKAREKEIEEDAKRTAAQEKLKTEVEKLKKEKRERKGKDDEYIDSEIIRLRGLDKPMSFSEIAKLFEVSKQSIHKRYKKLVDEGRTETEAEI